MENKESKKNNDLDNYILLIKKLLERNGYKFTVQKRIILEKLFESDIHLSAYEIYERVKENNIGLATVYRTMKVFSDLGIIKEITVNGQNYYELKGYKEKTLNIHFHCIKCNSVIDVAAGEIALEYMRLNKLLEDVNGFEIYDVGIMFHGICKKCKAKGNT